MSDIVDLNSRRDPVRFTVEITAYWDGTFDALVKDVSESERSRDAVADILVRLAERYLSRKVAHAADDMLAIMLANIDHAMATSVENPAVFTVGPDELAKWADAVQKYESVRF